MTPQSVKDALADAETLRLNAMDIYRQLPGCGLRLKHYVYDAEIDGEWAIEEMSPAGRIQSVYAYAARAARSALLAVPGLRGDL